MMTSSGVEAFVAAARLQGNADIEFVQSTGQLRFSSSSRLNNAITWLRGKFGLARGANTRTQGTYHRFLEVLSTDSRGEAHARWAAASLGPDRAVNKPLATRKVRQILAEIDRKNADTDPEAGRFLPREVADSELISRHTSSTYASSASLSGESEVETGTASTQRSPGASPRFSRPASFPAAETDPENLLQVEADDIGLLNP